MSRLDARNGRGAGKEQESWTKNGSLADRGDRDYSCRAPGIGGELIPKEALEHKQEERLDELARRFVARIKEARGRMAAAR